MILTEENPSTRKSTCLTYTWLTTDLTRRPQQNPGLGGERLAINRLRHGTATYLLHGAESFLRS